VVLQSRNDDDVDDDDDKVLAVIIIVIELTQEIGRRITTITEDTRETTFLFQRLSMALQRGNAVSFHNTMVTE